MSTAKYRHEYKYLISAQQLAMLKMRAEAILSKDANVPAAGPFAGFYNIRSVYFDDLQDRCYYENENGTDPREKFRIRIYNHSDRKISLELKSKRSGMCLKQSCPLTREQCEQLISGRPLPITPEQPPLLKKLLLQMNTIGLHPVCIVEYDRIPFTYPTGNVRVTLDQNIRVSTQCTRLFDADLPTRPILGTGKQILEIKWDELLPNFIYHTMMLDNLQWTSFSKYYLCRALSRKSGTEFQECVKHEL